MKKIILVNIIAILCLFGISEFVSYLFLHADTWPYQKPYDEAARREGRPTLTQRYAPIIPFSQHRYEKNMRHVNKGEGKTVLFFGCSYTWGMAINENETLPYIVSKKTGRATLNRGVPGGSILHSVHDLKNGELFEKLKEVPEVEYIVYTVINDHINRINNPYMGVITPRRKRAFYWVTNKYEIEGNEIKEKVPSKLKLLYYFFYTVKALHYRYAHHFNRDLAERKLFDLLLCTKKITDEKFPGSKFVVIDYKDSSRILRSDEFKDNLRENGFIVFDAEDLAGHELDSDVWRSKDKEHPSGAAFEDVANGLIKELNL